MITIKYIGNPIDGDKISTRGNEFIKLERIDKNNLKKEDRLVILSDMYIKTNINKNIKKVALLLEPPSILHQIYNNDFSSFTIVLTFSNELLKRDPSKFKFCPSSCNCWINEEDVKIHEKSKIVSIIASSKNYAEGHILRHNVIRECSDKLKREDVFGGGYKTIENKIIGCKDYAFQIVIENSKLDYYFTEKIIDVFATGCVPIYWGCPSIGNFFNINGILTFDTVDELKQILNNISLDKYQEMLPYVKENFEKAEKYFRPEKWIYNEIKDL